MTMPKARQQPRFLCRFHRRDSVLGWLLEDLEAEKHGTRPIITSAIDGDDAQRRVLELLATGGNAMLGRSGNDENGREQHMAYKGEVKIKLSPQDERDLALIAAGAGVKPEVQALQWVKDAIDRLVVEANGAVSTQKRRRAPAKPHEKRDGAGRHRIDPAELDTACENVLDAVRPHADGLNKGEIRESSGGDRSVVDAAIQRLVRTGKLERKGITSKTRYYTT